MENSVEEYFIVASDSAVGLSIKVGNKLSSGWEPLGSPFARHAIATGN